MKNSKIAVLAGAAVVASVVIAGNVFAGGDGGCNYSGGMAALKKAEPLVPADTAAEGMDPKWLLLLKEKEDAAQVPQPVVHN